MAWDYADYEQQPTLAQRLDRARLHRTEIAQAIDMNVESDGMKVSRDILLRMLTHVDQRIVKFEKQSERRGRTGRVRMRFV